MKTLGVTFSIRSLIPKAVAAQEQKILQEYGDLKGMKVVAKKRAAKALQIGLSTLHKWLK